MSNLKHILLVSQNQQQEQALFEWTLSFANVHHAEVTVLQVLPQPDKGVLAWFQKNLPDDVMVMQKKQALKSFRSWQQQAEQKGVMLNIQVRFGKLFYSAIQFVLSESVDWLVKQTERESTPHIFDSQDRHLLRKCPCPVLLHKKGVHLPFQKVMASLDVDLDAGLEAGSDSEVAVTDPLNQAILNLALMVTQTDKATLEVVHAWQADAENLVRHWNTDLSDKALFAFTESMRQRHLNAVELELTSLTEVPSNVDIALPKGDATEVIPHVVALHQVDLLVMGTLGRHGLPGMIIGNTSESILEEINCSVLAIKPSHFVSPVVLAT